ncbi:hypothetical protein GF377_09290, partial [candidate division GN15 bacterium]|nr:hypothetical protein [candidate division GN15 bacterium]
EPFIIPFDQLNRDRAGTVGSKNAQLGELMTRVGMPIPEGFAISGWAYKRFMDANDLQARITDRIGSVNFQAYAQLVEVSDDIQRWINAAKVPDDLREELEAAARALSLRTGSERFAFRSSAVGEDTIFSFAGQYATFLNVSVDDAAGRYQQILASKFTPQAIYYLLSHALMESELAMSVGCVEMVDARSAGVIYTRNPVRPKDNTVLISSVFGLGKYLVDGTLTPDVLAVDRESLETLDRRIARKPVRLVLSPESGTVNEDVPESQQQTLSISPDEARQLTECALKIERHYGTPQDIEWAIDQRGKVFILQSRPLHVIEPTHAEGPDVSDYRALMDGGVTVCPGAGGGAVYHAVSIYDLPGCPDGAVVVAPHTFPGLVTVMGRASAIVTETGGTANHMATVAREYRVPTVSGMKGATAIPADRVVTVDASECVVYDKFLRELINARRPELELFSDMAIVNLLKDVVKLVSPLNLLHPIEEGFRAENCQTFHDIVRYCHQMAMEEMFTGGLNVEDPDKISLPLVSDIPLDVNIIFVDRTDATRKWSRGVPDDAIESVPMQHFWNGVKYEGWPRSIQMHPQSMMSVLTTSTDEGEREDYSETSFAILGAEYMILSLRMGYHFTTVEAMCSRETRNNYIRMQYKEGGASVERRARRIRLIMDVLSCVGFEHQSKGDFLDTSLAYQEPDMIKKRLYMLGRLTMMTKQLDMALSNDSIARWYTRDFMRKLGIPPREPRRRRKH